MQSLLVGPGFDSLRVGTSPDTHCSVDLAAIPAVYGANGLPKDRCECCRRASSLTAQSLCPDYRARHPPGKPALINMSGMEHAHRRRLWNRGLGKSQLINHTRTASAGVDRLRVQFDKFADSGEPVDVTMWMRLYGCATNLFHLPACSCLV